MLHSAATNAGVGSVGTILCTNPVTAPFAYAAMGILGTYGTIESGSSFINAMNDPNATTGQKVAYGMDTLLSAAGTAFAVKGFMNSIKCSTPQTNTNQKVQDIADEGTGGGKNTVTSNTGNTYDNTPSSKHDA